MSEKHEFRITLTTGQTLSQKKDSTLLESIESENIEIHRQCREGYCGACRTKLISGKVHYLLDPLAFIDEDEILPCCCVASEDLELQIL